MQERRLEEPETEESTASSKKTCWGLMSCAFKPSAGRMLGLDVVCIQAKRWQNTVGRPDVQGFAGSMEGVRARKGVMITTSTFSKEAHEYVGKIERKIVLIDGQRLAELMIDHGIGVEVANSYVIKKLDSDYFMDEEAI